MANSKEKLAVYFTEEERKELDRWYKATNCSSRTEFVTEAVRFYIDYLKTEDAKVFLPVAIGSAIDGKLGTFEDRVAGLLFKQSVELDMLMRLMAYNNRWYSEDIDDLRRESVKAVRSTNGALSFKQVAQQMRSRDGEAGT